MTTVESTEAAPAPVAVRHVAAGRPLHWLRAGLQDIAAMPIASLSYGVLLAAVGYLIVSLASGRPYLVSAALSGFFLAGPFLGIGLYHLSRERGAGRQPRFLDSLTAWRRNAWSIGMFGVMLAFVLLSWERVSAILFALFHGRQPPGIQASWTEALFGAADPLFLASYVLIGGVLAAGVFAVSVIALPMLLDRPLDPVTAAITSFTATRTNPSAMLVWAVLIVLLVGIGLATAFLGLIVTMPLVAHASWHAYRDLTGPA